MASPVARGGIRSSSRNIYPMYSHGTKQAIASRFAITTARSRHGRPGRTTDAGTRPQWLYCATCHPTLFEQADKQDQCHVPFRDAASLVGPRGVAAVPRLLDPPEAWTRATAQKLREPIRSAEDH